MKREVQGVQKSKLYVFQKKREGNNYEEEERIRENVFKSKGF